MKNILALVLLLSVSLQTYSQLYKSKSRRLDFYVEIKNDTAHVEIFHVFLPYFVRNIKDELLPMNNSHGDTIYKGGSAKILQKRNSIYLVYRTENSKKTRKTKLKLCESDNRRFLRNESYAWKKERYIARLQDSLSAPDTDISVLIHGSFRSINKDSISENELIKRVNKRSDFKIKLINELRNPIVDAFYRKADSIAELDSNEIFELLSNANYRYSYAKYLLYQVATEKPEILIQYVDKDPANKDNLLKAIKNDWRNKEITKSIRSTDIRSKGKKQIVKQRSKRVLRDTANGAAVVGIVAAEIAIIPVLLILLL